MNSATRAAMALRRRLTGEPLNVDAWAALPEAERRAYRSCVDVVLQAIREPTRREIKGAARALAPDVRPTPNWVSCGVKHRIRFAAVVDRMIEDELQ